MVRLVAFDTETFQITTYNKTPKLVCVQLQVEGEEPELHHGGFRRIDELFFELARDRDNVFVLHNAAFDMAVLVNEYPTLTETIFGLYDDGRIRDTMIREKLIGIKVGDYEDRRFNLASLALRYCNVELDKSDDGPRLRYGDLYDTSMDLWPSDAVQYALDDPALTLRVYKAQAQQSPGYPTEALEQRNVRAHFALYLTSCRGLLTDPVAVQKLKRDLESELSVLQGELLNRGVYKKKDWEKKGELVRDMKLIRERVTHAYENTGRETPMTEKGNVKTDEITLRESGDETLATLAETGYSTKLMTTYVPVLEARTVAPIGCSYNPCLQTERTSSYKPNDQNLPRKEGVRECYIPQPGYLFVSADYTAAELVALAQVHLEMFGHSAMADAIKRGDDLHLRLVAQLVKSDYTTVLSKHKADDAEIKKLRQFAKIANFGFPGGLLPTSLVKQAKNQGVNISLDTAESLYKAFFATWVEMTAYFERATDACWDLGSRAVMTQHGLIRGRVRKNQWLNTHFQQRVAIGAKDAHYEATKAAYIKKTSPLYGARPSAFVHDELRFEVPTNNASVAAEELVNIMVATMSKYIPDVPVRAEANIASRWYKGAKTVRDDEGRIIEWEP